MGSFLGPTPVKATTKPKTSTPSTGGSGGSSPTPLKTSPALTPEENAARMAANRAAGVGDVSGRSPSDPNYNTAPQAPSSQFRTGGGAALVSQSMPVQRLTREQTIQELAYRQKVSQEARAYAQQTYNEVIASPSRRIEREEAEREAARQAALKNTRATNQGVIYPANASSPTTRTDLGSKTFVPFNKQSATITRNTQETTGNNIITFEQYQQQKRLESDNPAQRFIDVASFRTQKNVPVAFEKYSSPFISSLAVPLLVGATTTTAQFIGHPVETAKGMFTFITSPVKSIKETQSSLSEMTATKGPEYTLSYVGGSFLASAALLKTAQAAYKVSPVKVEYESVNIATKGGGSVTTKEIGVRVGPYGKTLGSRTTVKPAVQNLATGEYLTDTSTAPMSAEYTRWNVGAPKLAQKVTPAELATSTAQPLTASGGKALQGIVELSPAEKTRLQSNVNVAYLLGKEKGLPVKEFVVNIDEVKNPRATTRILEKYSGQEGTLFGSLTTKQLPGKQTRPYSLKYLGYTDDGKPVSVSSYQNLKQGDVDLIFPEKTVAQIQTELPGVVKQLRAAGENVEISPQNQNIIQFKGTQNKLLEVKSGIDQASLGLGDEAPAGYLGIKFPDFKKGQASSNVPFGETYAIRAGEQLQRKGAGSVIIGPGDAGETPSFSQPGVLGKQGNPRGLKYTAGFLQQSTGIIEIRASSKNPLKRASASIAKGEVNKWLSSYTLEQQADIVNKFKTTTGSIELTPQRNNPNTGTLPEDNAVLTAETTAAEAGFLKSTTKETETSNIFKSSKNEPSPRVSRSPSISKGYSSVITSPKSLPSSLSSVSPKVSPLTSPSPYVSPSKSFYSKYSVSPSASPSVSRISSPSPRGSPSISPSPSPSPSPSLSPSPSPSISPSPSPSPSPTPSPGPIPSEFPTPTRIKTPISFTTKSKDKTGSYEVSVRSRGIFRRVATTNTLGEAFTAGRVKVQQTAAASFKVRAIGQPESSTLTGRQYLPAKTFYESKKEPGVFIQKRGARISTPGEKREITLKGIQATRLTKSNKKNFGVF